LTVLLDLNVLVALAWPAHEHHHSALKWFLSRGKSKWATCPLTQLGFIRLLSNPAFSTDALTVPEALELLNRNVQQPAHEFWPDSLPAPRALRTLVRDPFAHRLVTDSYLLSLAVRRKARLATFDRGLLQLATEAKLGTHIELISRL
jgi:toxin-antitoxin system PIN domain toxin